MWQLKNVIQLEKMKWTCKMSWRMVY